MLARPISLILAVCAALATTASAQPSDTIEAVDQRWVVALADNTPLRCGDFERFYPVAILAEGTPLHLDGQSTEWARIVYPQTLSALVSARDAEPIGSSDDGTQLVRLVRPSKLRAANTNPNVGVAGSWRSVFRSALPVGTDLELIETITGSSGSVEGYRVRPPHPPVAPHPPHAYVLLDDIREATLEERARFNRAETETETETPPVETPAEADPVEVIPAETPPAQTEPEPTPEPAPNVTPAPAPMPMPADTDRAEPNTDAPTEPAPADTSTTDNTQPTPAEGETPAETPAETPVETPETTPADPEPQPEPTTLQIEELEDQFIQIRRLGRQALDDALDEVIGEYRRTRATLTEPTFIRIADSRLEWLELRRATRDERRELDAALAAADDRTGAIRERLAAIERTRRYAVVGRLVPSPLYDGDPLPLMYRVESIGGSTASRTLGYVRPRASDDLTTMLGEIVGVVGDVRIDRALGLLLVRPVRVDVLTTDLP